MPFASVLDAEERDKVLVFDDMGMRTGWIYAYGGYLRRLYSYSTYPLMHYYNSTFTHSKLYLNPNPHLNLSHVFR